MTYTAANFGVNDSNATQQNIDSLNLALKYLEKEESM